MHWSREKNKTFDVAKLFLSSLKATCMGETYRKEDEKKILRDNNAIELKYFTAYTYTTGSCERRNFCGGKGQNRFARATNKV